MSLETEIQFFEENRSRYLREHKGKYVLIKERECLGFFDTDATAYEKGVEMFGVEPFLIKQVLPEDPIDQAPALTHGLLSASV